MYLPDSDRRAAALIDWLQTDLGLPVQTLEPASSDASFRRYFRVGLDDGFRIVMDAPPDRENIRPFVRIASHLKQVGINTPTIYAENSDDGFLLLEDFGSDVFLDCLNDNNAEALYRQALACLLQLQTTLTPSSCPLPVYDDALLQRELDIFYDWFLEKLLGIVMPDAMRRELDRGLIESALEQPRVFVHRDFHSRNLMVVTDNMLGVIDFQDAVIGPISYDLVSLLRDCYVAWPSERVAKWRSQHYQSLVDAGLLAVTAPVFDRWFDWMGLQRHLKAIGIFARLHLRDDKSSYLADIPRTLAYVNQVCAAYPALEEVHGFLRRQILPVYQASL
ncbi:MAG: phosphotransferase [Methylomonas sp.]|nr:phosphotransferase [Methylomonas sp.]PPD21829.1 MAG: aminoglycoside phosphotransferase [Methylomonas sp.]PPD27113.1 MAG: aminoglycoside phosphotransferase [Methylomonas sp.]PPD39067.1 MAG: aminoglycoside phosphotransferase [Methylomonas sp.]PPD42295.1 MAG: aminoglycoside phosphotransferase [Methylomonas sp.]